MAHDDMRLANIYVNSGELLDANINRSPYAYYNNPDEEIERLALSRKAYTSRNCNKIPMGIKAKY